MTRDIWKCAINGLELMNDFLTPSEQQDLIDSLELNPWSSDLARPTQQFGYKFPFGHKKPDWVEPCDPPTSLKI